MEISFTGHHVEITPTLKNFSTEKFAKLERHSNKIQTVHLTIESEGVYQVAKATVTIKGAEPLYAHDQSENVRSAIELVINKLDRQLIKLKEKQEDHRH